MTVMNPSSGDFDPLARSYRTLEYLVFGRELERARHGLLSHLKNCQRILVLGDGDGRCLEKLVVMAPTASIDCIDCSAAMLDQARLRVQPHAERINFQQADILRCDLPSRHYDAVVTCFVLDCFDAVQTESIVTRIATSLQPGARWLWVDFAVPNHGFARWRAQIWLAALYAFFHWQTGLSSRALPPSEALIEAAGFRLINRKTRQWGLLCSCVYSSTEV